MSILNAFFRRTLDRGARGKSYADFQRALAKTGETVHGRFVASSDTPRHREKGQHIVGIERWSQSRLRIALGDTFQRDEYGHYRPGGDMDLPALTQAFAATRAESVRIAQELEAAGVPINQTAPHNQFGDLTIGGWLNYIIIHSGRESRLL